ncbi:MAG: hypothetical protein [Microvirus sp.]|nr:MAG: hypothetical protein [Microvirus sp.]
MKRYKMNNKASKRNFTGNASNHPKNFKGAPMRGGIRL